MLYGKIRPTTTNFTKELSIPNYIANIFFFHYYYKKTDLLTKRFFKLIFANIKLFLNNFWI